MSFSVAENLLSDLVRDLNHALEDGDYAKEKACDQRLLSTLSFIVMSVDKALKKGPLSPEDLERAERVLNAAVTFGYTGGLNLDAEDSDGRLFDDLDSFAHGVHRPLLRHGPKEGAYSHRTAMRLEHLALQSQSPIPWKKSQKFDPHTSPCARFTEGITFSSPPETMPLAVSIYQARVEATSGHLDSAPICFAASPKGRFLAMPNRGGWKLRHPHLSYFHTDGQPPDCMDGHRDQLALADIAFSCAVDDDSGLVFVGDRDRVKSYSWWDTMKDAKRKGLLPVHTLKSVGYEGAIGMLPKSGRVARAGKGKIGIWKLEDLATHGESGKELVGGDLTSGGKDISTWRDDPKNIERSVGSEPHSTVTLSWDEGYEISKWHVLPGPGEGAFILTTSDTEKSHRYYCRLLNMEAGAQCASRYLGHGGGITRFSTSAADPNVFLTACDDGYARLYDVRIPLPVLTIQPSIHSKTCTAALLCHPDGIPYIFLSDSDTEAVTLWDPRVGLPVYELATGNNKVIGLAWNSERNELYAASESPYLIDSSGMHSDYRKARIPKELQRESMEEYSLGRAWPRKAFHEETHFGHIFDAGEHRVFRYAFKENADLTMIPPDGGVEVSSRGGAGWGGYNHAW